MATVIEKVDRLEEAPANFATSVGIELNKPYNSEKRTESEMRAFKDEVRNDRHKMNHKRSDFSNKLCTIVEDLLYPSLSRIEQDIDRFFSGILLGGGNSASRTLMYQFGRWKS